MGDSGSPAAAAPRGEPNAAIERATGRTRKTIRRYKRRARKLGWEPGGEREPDEELAAAVRAEPAAGDRAARGWERSRRRLMPQRTAITEWVSPADGSRGLRLSKVHDLLARQGVRGPVQLAASLCGELLRLPRTPARHGARGRRRRPASSPRSTSGAWDWCTTRRHGTAPRRVGAAGDARPQPPSVRPRQLPADDPGIHRRAGGRLGVLRRRAGTGGDRQSESGRHARPIATIRSSSAPSTSTPPTAAS